MSYNEEWKLNQIFHKNLCAQIHNISKGKLEASMPSMYSRNSLKLLFTTSDVALTLWKFKTINCTLEKIGWKTT